MKAIHIFLIFSILSLNAIFAEKEPNLDDPKVQDQIIAIAAQKLEKRKKANGEYLEYLPFRQVPYTGWYAQFESNGQVFSLSQYKDGKADGLSTHWYQNGQKSAEIKMNDGKIINVKVWLPDGKECPESNVKDGTGVRINYRGDGTVALRYTYKDSETVEMEFHSVDGSFTRTSYKGGKEVKKAFYRKDGTLDWVRPI